MLSANSTASGKQKFVCGATKEAKIREAIITEKRKGERRKPNIQPPALQGTSGQQAERVTGRYSKEKEQSFGQAHVS